MYDIVRLADDVGHGLCGGLGTSSAYGLKLTLPGREGQRGRGRMAEGKRRSGQQARREDYRCRRSRWWSHQMKRLDEPVLSRGRKCRRVVAAYKRCGSEEKKGVLAGRCRIEVLGVTLWRCSVQRGSSNKSDNQSSEGRSSLVSCPFALGCAG